MTITLHYFIIVLRKRAAENSDHRRIYLSVSCDSFLMGAVMVAEGKGRKLTIQVLRNTFAHTLLDLKL